MKLLFDCDDAKLKKATGIINGLICGRVCWGVIVFVIYLIWLEVK